ncbi:putative carboxylesterase 18 [Morella rubra]|uniref:Putative carboxylesterase 18 n=1 Tax=Morella rubra TaxID=262757 RepID=A0A6A1UI55_9ROSI|nr:putative carboxylesterase 18 [Morella rubra]
MRCSCTSSGSHSVPPGLPLKTRFSLSLLSAACDIVQRRNGTLNRRVVSLLDSKSPPARRPIKGVKSSDVTVDPARKLWFRLFIPTTTATSLPVIVFFHGGGFAFNTPSSKAYNSLCRRLARKLPAVVVSAHYRLTPEYRYPCQYDDCFDVLKFLDRNKDDKLRVLPEIADTSKCFLAGDSAGGNLAHHVAVRACRERFQAIKVAGLVSIQPYFGGEERTDSEIRLANAPLVSVPRTDWGWKAFLPEGANRDHEAVNVSGPNAVDISGLDYPDTIVFVGGYDPIQDWQRRYYEWLRKSRKQAKLIEFPNMFHAFYLFPGGPPESAKSKLIEHIKDFVSSKV